MSGNLSQEEIDSLLKGQNTMETPLDKPPAIRGKSRPHEAPPASASPAARPPAIKPAVFAELPPEVPVEAPVAGMEVLLDVPLAISVELGRARCFVKDLMGLSAGSVVELDKAAGDMVDILVNGKLFARGEVVVIDENFGVRIQEIVNRR